MKPIQTALAALALSLAFGAAAQEAAIRKNLAERLPNMPRIDEVSKTPMAGLYEVRINGSELFYTDAEGNFLIQGQLMDTRQRRNLTEERVDKLTAVAFDALPLKNAFTIVRGNGERQMAIFEDPNCGFCKRFEKDLQKLDNVTILHVLYPILGEDSKVKSKNIWCAKDKAKVWNDWMLNGVLPPAASCDTAPVEANVEFGKKNRITGTPTLFFADGTRVVGAVPLTQIESQLAQVK